MRSTPSHVHKLAGLTATVAALQSCLAAVEEPTDTSGCSTFQLVVSLNGDDPDLVLSVLEEDFPFCEQDPSLIDCFVTSDTKCRVELERFEVLREAESLSATAACAPLCEA